MEKLVEIMLAWVVKSVFKLNTTENYKFPLLCKSTTKNPIPKLMKKFEWMKGKTISTYHIRFFFVNY